ncbi:MULTISPECIES: acyltransferase [unclassified Breznakia]|uniref:acyltransferase family protein n=1 Tax=unclassified Breznakia TaxID=2623764 RepID=UPI0024764570|nr:MULTISPECIES: acyltransferase [unclassified Breznakia]MDH6367895.1 peptidoglycan/LPS O-acetylase OafA/YrhL [Breznakia sp. PH1-1]MDH6404983.1 peptidoglycan/LPS O-acetylase OafA/YrhL [Breznakia sp. PF1-11]MDH6412706.1 peptidoglycan/LPS O-acetylase OafA/YrhL [Breznakia sp. PFB1-11]MDH6415058.1 peptidoglycan/LPS O-acetylase OafA/YrhL [Breznakia sp. PFB1-14]MDH6417369.1 peptidoglycan/LPS O-acetylase OafA/YrhL [Breznakia sp. PFB1-4]
MNEKKYTLEDALNNRKSNNLSIMKLIAAILVIVSHSYTLTGSSQSDVLKTLTNNQESLGGLAVAVFFFSSGLLISRSIQKNYSFKGFFKARVKRIIPSLCIVIVFCTFVMGPILTTLPLFSYITNVQTWKYLLNIVLIPIHSLPGVFINAPYGSVVNGSLWTLPVEFCCYIIVFGLFHTKFLDKKRILLLSPLALLAFVLCNFTTIPLFVSLRNYIQPVLIYYVGVLAYVYRDCISIKNWYGILALILIILCFALGIGKLGMILFAPVLFIVVGFSKKQVSSRIGELGKYSYAIYLVAFPIQQCLVYIFANQMSPLVNSILSILVSFVFAKILLKTESVIFERREKI